MSDLISRSELIKELNKYCGSQRYLVSENIREIINNQPTAYDIDKVVEELEERTDFLKDCTKYGNKNAKQQDKSYSAMMMYEVADLVDDLIEIVKQGIEDIPSESGVLPKDVYSAGYNKDLEDFKEAIDKEDREEPLVLDMFEIEEIAEKLKK